jgi:hypothetical protein
MIATAIPRTTPEAAIDFSTVAVCVWPVILAPLAGKLGKE